MSRRHRIAVGYPRRLQLNASASPIFKVICVPIISMALSAHGLSGQSMEISEVHHLGPRTMQEGVVSGLPFQARFEEIRKAEGEFSSIIASGAIYRDSQGRTRKELEWDVGDETIKLVVITDPATGKGYVLNPRSKRAMKTIDFPPDAQRDTEPGWLFPGHAVEVGREKISDRDCQHFTITPAHQDDCGAANEVWIDDVLKTVVKEKAGSPGDERTWRLFQLERKDADASLFEVPSDYILTQAPNFGKPVE